VIRAEMLQGKDKVSSVPEAVKKIVARVLSWKSGCKEKILCAVFGVCNSVRLLSSLC
jgi:hypothetical protein